MTRPDIGDALAEAARVINAPDSLEDTLDAIVQTARNSLDGIDHVGISVAHRNGSIETLAGTGQIVWELDDIQYRLHEGPCVHAIEREPIVLVENAREEQAWPNYMPQALERGLTAQLALRLHADDETLGGLNLYSTTSDTLDPRTVHTAGLFAVHAALALGKALQLHQLQIALGSRKVIGQAIGLVMERYGLTEDRAFAFLARTSSTTNVKLRDVAAELVHQAEEAATYVADHR